MLGRWRGRGRGRDGREGRWGCVAGYKREGRSEGNGEGRKGKKPHKEKGNVLWRTFCDDGQTAVLSFVMGRKRREIRCNMKGDENYDGAKRYM